MTMLRSGSLHVVRTTTASSPRSNSANATRNYDRKKLVPSRSSRKNCCFSTTKTVSKLIFFNLFAAFFNLSVTFSSLLATFFNLFAAFFNLFVLSFNLSAVFSNLFVSFFSLFAVFLNLFVTKLIVFEAKISEKMLISAVAKHECGR